MADNSYNNDGDQNLVKVQKDVREEARELASQTINQTDEYGQRVQDAALKAKDYAAEKFNQVSSKLKELDGKDPQQLVEEAKNYARKNPGQALAISAAAGLLLGFLLKKRR